MRTLQTASPRGILFGTLALLLGVRFETIGVEGAYWEGTPNSSPAPLENFANDAQLVEELATFPSNVLISDIHRGGGLMPAGYNPFGYKITALGIEFLEFDGSLDSDVGRFISTLKERKTTSAIKTQWLEILRVSKSAQTMRIYRQNQELIEFCLKAGFLD